MTTFGLLIFDGAEELDFVGPWEVFTASAMIQAETGVAADTCVTVAEHGNPVRCAKGLRVLADHSIADHPPLDVLVIPGGVGARCGVPDTLLGWVRKTAADASWVTSVCTGAFVLHDAGLAQGRRVATHHAYEDDLAARGEVTVVRDARYVVDGNLVTSQGVSAGIDMALWLVGHIHGRQHARAVRRYIQYDPVPPYLADEPLTRDPAPKSSRERLRGTVRTHCRTEVTDRMQIFGQRHLRSIPAQYAAHYKDGGPIAVASSTRLAPTTLSPTTPGNG